MIPAPLFGIKNQPFNKELLVVRCGDGGIRTRGTPLRVRRFSKPVVSATHPRHLDK